MKSFDEFMAEEEAKERAAAQPAQPDAPPERLVGGRPTLDVQAEIAKTMNAQPKKPVMPGDTPRMAAPDDPTRREIALDASRASAANAETAEQSATRRYEGLLAGTQSAVPFFPRIRGYVAGAVAERAAALRALAGQEPENTDFAREQAAYLERKNAERQIAKASARAPVESTIGAVTTGALTPAVGPLKMLGKTSGPARVLDSAAIGAGYGASAADRPGVSSEEMLAGAGVGAGIGAVGGLVGEAARPIVRGAPGREDKAFIREIVRTEGGEGANAMLARNKEGLVREYENVIAQRHIPEIRKAVNMPEGKGAPIISKKVEPYAVENHALYRSLDKKAVSGNPTKRAGQMTAGRLTELLEDAKKNVSAEGAARLDGVIRDLNEHYVPRTWNGEEVIPSGRLRHWLTSVQDSAARVPGSLNATQAFESTMEAQREATRVFNDYLDSIGAPKLVTRIRANNEKMTPLLRIRDALETKGKKEQLEHMGLGKIMEEQTRKLELGAAAGAAASGHPVAAAAILARAPASKATARSLRWLNREVLEPMQLAAEKGAPMAALARFGIERGLPQGVANQFAAKLAGGASAGVRSSQTSPEVVQGNPMLEKLFTSDEGAE